MIRFAFLFLLFFLTLLLENVSETMGLGLVLTPPVIFYCTYVYGMRWGIPAAILTGMFSDFSIGMEHPWCIAGFLFSVGLAVFWLRVVDSGEIHLLLIPGLLLPLPVLLIPLLHHGFTADRMLDALSGALVWGMIWGPLLPLLIAGLDSFCSLIGLRTFAEARTRYHMERKDL